MYLLIKVQKHKLDTIETIDTNNIVFRTESICVEYHLQEKIHLILTYLWDSNHILNELKRLSPLPPGTKLFTTDEFSMYLNINIYEGLATARTFLKYNSKELPIYFPTYAILNFMRLVLRNNVFHFGETCWIQKRGKSMGTLLAVFTKILSWDTTKNKTINCH